MQKCSRQAKRRTALSADCFSRRSGFHEDHGAVPGETSDNIARRMVRYPNNLNEVEVGTSAADRIRLREPSLLLCHFERLLQGP